MSCYSDSSPRPVTPVETTGTVPPVEAFPPQIPHDYQPEDTSTCSTTDSETTLPPRFQRGDHVYNWCSVLGIPRVFSHHGIVLDVQELDGEEQLLTIVDFSNLLLKEHNDNDKQQEEQEREQDYLQVDDARTIRSPPQSTSFTGGTSSSKSTKKGHLRLYKYHTTSKDSQWNKVTYGDHWFHTHFWKRSGTCTPIQSDPPNLVLKRVHFLLQQSPQALPEFHPIYANCECVAVFCKTGTWCTLQASSFLSHAAVGQVKATATLSTFCAAQTATVPAAGFWGWMGYTTTVPLMSVQPFILPALCAYGAVTIGGPAICLTMAKKRWKDITNKLQQAMEVEDTKVALVVA